MTVIAAIALAAALASGAPTPTPTGWSVLYTTSDRSSAFNTVFATGGDTWVAGGPSIIVVQSSGVAQPHKIDRDVSYIAGTPFGVYAIGSGGTVWSIHGGTLREEHHLPGPRKKRDPMTLDWLAPGKIAGRPGVFAFGTALMLFGSADGTWTPVAEAEAEPIRKILLYDRGADVKGCDGRAWIPLRDPSDTGFLACEDRRTYVGGNSLQSHPRLPKDCPRPYSAARGTADHLVVVCDNRKPWLLVESEDGWTKKAAPLDVIQVHTAGSCTLAATARSIWRTCD
jgi:hypothetical protein